MTNDDPMISRYDAVELLAKGVSTNGKVYLDDADALLSKSLYANPLGMYRKSAIVYLIDTIVRARNKDIPTVR